MIDKEPWAICEILNRMHGKVDKGVLGHAVETEIADQIDFGSLTAEELRGAC